MTAPDVQIIGSYLSPYVRKVLAILELKGVSYEIDPIVPFFGNEEFSRLSPLRRIPVLIDSSTDQVVNDSTVIIEYLEERYPNPSVFPQGPFMRSQARWIEEYADSRLGDVFIWQVFNQNIRKFVWGLEVDEVMLENALQIEIPSIMEYLEKLAPSDGFLLGEYSLADIALAAFFRNLQFARCELDSNKWPNTLALIARVFERKEFTSLAAYEQVSLRVPAADQRNALLDTDAPIMAETFGTKTPVAGPMTQR